MTLRTVGILSPGDMGHAVGQVLGSKGVRVITCLQGRSERTRSLATRAQIEDVPTYQTLVKESDMVLSILAPARAREAGGAIAKAIAETEAQVIYADCNAIAPQTVSQIGEIVEKAGGRFVDAGIIGPPPGKGRTTFFYVSGPHAKAFEELSRFGLNVIVLGEQVGLASALKMCYGASTKGMVALFTELLTAAEILGVSQPLKERLQSGDPSLLYRRLERDLPGMPEKSGRWIGEMEEMAKTFERVGLTPNIFTGAADIYRFVRQTELATRTPEDATPRPDLPEVIEVLARSLRRRDTDPQS